MLFRVEITTDNAAFGDDDPTPELARIMWNLGDMLNEEQSNHTHVIRDANGNVVGSWDLVPQ